jgi:threonylcarbamoyladenosine tRNA methylthiotransferase MtaB
MKIFLDMVGCRLNQSELENIARQFRSAGHSLCSNPESADLVVINTCTVTAAAASDSRQKIRQAARITSGEVVVTGCWATMHPVEAAKFSGVSRVFNNQEKDTLVASVLQRPLDEFSHATLQRVPIPGARLRTRAFIKVQDGCDNHCTYCITRLARGKGKSTAIADVLADVESAIEGGAHEIALTGVHLGSWGYDLSPTSRLYELIKKILMETDTPRLRLSSLEPWDISPDFFELWQDPRLCRHLHLPLQSGCETTLKRMGRRVTPHLFAGLVQQARSSIPGVAITTDIITGFPGESEAEFSESAAFIRAMDFSNGHVFSYSAWPGTPAARLSGIVPQNISRQRNIEIRKVLSSSAQEFRMRHLGQQLQVLWEKAIQIDEHHWELSGLSDNYLRVKTVSASPLQNQVSVVKVIGMEIAQLVAKITETN